MEQYNKPRKSCALFGLGFMEMIPSPRLCFLRGVFLANHLVSNDNLARTTKTEHIPNITNNTQKGALLNTTHKNYTNRKIKPSLVAFYDIQPEGTGLFLQPRACMGPSTVEVRGAGKDVFRNFMVCVITTTRATTTYIP